jgi:hypothetical protein
VQVRVGVYRELPAEPIGGPGPDRFRRWLAGVALVVGLVLVATIASVSLRRPAVGCPADLPQQLTDDVAGMSLCLPAHWRDIKADDQDAWRAIYEGDESDAERWIKDGSMQHFAVPFSPPDDDGQVHLAIYIRDASPSTTLEDAQLDYRALLADDEAVLATDVVELTTATAALIVSERRRPSENGDAVVDHYLNWIFVEGGQTFYVLMASSDIHANEYRALFEAMAETVRLARLTTPATPMPT